jgi:GNAT superfamily N-acetyltransferase
MIRFAEKKDMVSVLKLIQELADFENEPDAVIVTEDDLIRDGFGSNPIFQCLVAEEAGDVVGMALFYPRYSTWKGPTFHLEDLIVTQSLRGKGFGKELYSAFINFAAQKQVRRIEWVVLDWNTHAIDFYKNSGADVLDDWKTVQMDEQAIASYVKGLQK